ncbi:MAG: UDP-4-amino-4,6-dideoxy-N-acetyl-beta-L-altrosamine N-acetyltransferase [Erysipelotrichales bacterium]
MLTLRNILDVDFATQMLVRDWRNSENIRKYMTSERIISEETHKKWIKSLENNNKTMFFIVFYEEKPIGIVTIYNIDYDNLKCEWGFYIFDTSLRGLGIGKRLEVSTLNFIFNEIGIKKLSCSVLETNPSVISMHKKMGFEQEGLFKEEVQRDDKRVDVIHLGMTSKTWEKIKNDRMQDIDLANIITKEN